MYFTCKERMSTFQMVSSEYRGTIASRKSDYNCFTFVFMNFYFILQSQSAKCLRPQLLIFPFPNIHFKEAFQYQLYH